MSSSIRAKSAKNAGGSSGKSMTSASQASSRGVVTKSGSSRPDVRGEEKNESIVRYTLEEIRSLGRRSDIERLRATTDEDIERQIAEDPDLQGFEEIDWSKAVLVVPPAKQPISIRLDEDVLAFFKAQGSGYQSRINKVLRHYMKSVKEPAE
jgi:uncharacterized protein (DUF4415 family)